MDDPSIVAVMVHQDPRGLEEAYRRYSDQLYTFCRGMLHDGHAAGDAVHDTFVIAANRIGELRDPNRLRAWLYAIARNECLRQLRGTRRTTPVAEMDDVSAETAQLDLRLRDEEIRELVWSAAEGVNPGDREVLDLSVRYELSTQDLADILGVSANHAHARLSRARTQLERSLGTLLVARHGTAECPELAHLLAGWDGRLTSLLRKRIGRHIDNCTTCTDQRERRMSPAALLAAYAALPFLIAPDLWPRIERTCAVGHGGPDSGEAPIDPGGGGGSGSGSGDGSGGSGGSGGAGGPGGGGVLGGAAAAGAAAGALGLFDAGNVADRAGAFNSSTGFPRPLSPERQGLGITAAVAAAAVLLLLVGAGLFVYPWLSGDDPAAAPAAVPTSESVLDDTPSGSPAGSPTPSASPTASPTPSPTRTTPRAPTTQPPPPPAPSWTVSATASTTCTSATRYTLSVQARATGLAGEQIASASLTITFLVEGRPASRTEPMKVSGLTASAEIFRVDRPLTGWSVTATSSQGRSDQDEHGPVPNPCPIEVD